MLAFFNVIANVIAHGPYELDRGIPLVSNAKAKSATQEFPPDMKFKRRTLAGSILSALLLAACGSSATPPSAPASSTAAAPSSAPASSAAGSAASASSAASGSAAAKPSASSSSPAGSAASGSAAASAPAGSASASAGGASASAGAASGSAAASGAPNPTIAKITPLSPAVKLRTVVPPTSYNLPLFLAADKGYFSKAGLDIDMKISPGSATSLIPSLAKGDLDVLPLTPAPPFFNQALQGFDIKVISSIGQEMQGRTPGVVLTVVKSKADQIKDYKDLKGKTIDASNEGSSLALTALAAVKLGGLTPGKDVTMQYNAKTPADMVAMAKSGGADVIAMVEPIATQAINDGLVVRWKNQVDVAPWLQTSFLAASATYVQKNPQAVQKFLEVLIAAAREIDATNGQWTPELLASDSKWLNTPQQTITQQGGPIYADPNLALSTDSISMAQDVWIEQALVKQKVDVSKVIELGPLNNAVQEIGKA